MNTVPRKLSKGDTLSFLQVRHPSRDTWLSVPHSLVGLSKQEQNYVLVGYQTAQPTEAYRIAHLSVSSVTMYNPEKETFDEIG